MTSFVTFLVLVVLAYSQAAPATNSGIAHSSGGSVAVGIVEGSSFGEGAFTITRTEGNNNNNDKPCGLLKYISIFVPSVKC
ncbi:hypothetical protein B5X24_HaOG209422 [Helicoverpa armigera]|uniref:Uncharacterized protein n=1 Tax=Helicoverpa armigera TaxID=29058 RepID=A0A2W1BIM7_HELAM|nr:hypothetical protein B5X24_HaOG209422 [Helicoverpa armigera]